MKSLVGVCLLMTISRINGRILRRFIPFYRASDLKEGLGYETFIYDKCKLSIDIVNEEIKKNRRGKTINAGNKEFMLHNPVAVNSSLLPCETRMVASAILLVY